MDPSLNYDFTDPVTVSRLIGLLVPILVAVIAKKVSSSGLKAVLNLLLSAVGASVAYLVTKDGDFDFATFVNAVLNTFVVSIMAYYGLLKPTGVTDTVAQKTANFGIGTPPAPPLETEDKGAQDEGEAIAEAVATPGPGSTPAYPPATRATLPAKKAAAKKAVAAKRAVKKATEPKE